MLLEGDVQMMEDMIAESGGRWPDCIEEEGMAISSSELAAWRERGGVLQRNETSPAILSDKLICQFAFLPIGGKLNYKFRWVRLVDKGAELPTNWEPAKMKKLFRDLGVLLDENGDIDFSGLSSAGWKDADK